MSSLSIELYSNGEIDARALAFNLGARSCCWGPTKARDLFGDPDSIGLFFRSFGELYYAVDRAVYVKRRVAGHKCWLEV